MSEYVHVPGCHPQAPLLQMLQPLQGTVHTIQDTQFHHMHRAHMLVLASHCMKPCSGTNLE